MKTTVAVIFAFILSSTFLHAQETYTVDGEELQLEKTVEGPITLLWTKSGGVTRYFSKKENEIVELKNTLENGTYREEYKDVLTHQTYNTLSATDVKLNLRSLSNFFVTYNNRIEKKEVSRVEGRFGIFGGVDNAIYTSNPENAVHPKFGATYEILEHSLKRHSAVFEANYTFKTKDHDYTAFQLALNYRFKFVQTSKLDIFVNAKIVTFTSSTLKYWVVDEDNPTGPLVQEKISGPGIKAPLIFGLGADYRLGDGYVTLGFNDLVAIDLKSNKEFPINFSLGYKFIL